jgi:hypothetical protein
MKLLGIISMDYDKTDQLKNGSTVGQQKGKGKFVPVL